MLHSGACERHLMVIRIWLISYRLWHDSLMPLQRLQRPPSVVLRRSRWRPETIGRGGAALTELGISQDAAGETFGRSKRHGQNEALRITPISKPFWRLDRHRAAARSQTHRANRTGHPQTEVIVLAARTRRGISTTRSALKPSADYGQLGSRRQPSGAIPTRLYRDLHPGVHQDLINYFLGAPR
jgi:hypothetical protein